MNRQFSPPLRNVASITVEGNTATFHRLGEGRVTIDLPNDPARDDHTFNTPFTLTVDEASIDSHGRLRLTMPNGGCATFNLKAVP